MESGLAPGMPEILSGEGVILRPWTSADLGRMVELFDEPEIARWTPLASPFDSEAAAAYLERARHHALTRLQLAITLAGGEALGEVLLDIPDAFAGYMVGDAHRGQGLAGRALRVITAHAHHECGLAEVSMTISPNNAASCAVAVSAGYRVVADSARTWENKGRSITVETWVHAPPGPAD
jgi:RimJ/RimL family protein N-acetyltransferase